MVKHKHTWPGTIKCTEVGDGVCLAPVNDGFLVSFENNRTDGRLTGRIATTTEHGARITWDQIGTLEGGDLTLSPSILLDYGDGMSFHGWVQNGKWVPA